MTTVYDKNTISAKPGDQVVSCVTECLQKLMVYPGLSSHLFFLKALCNKFFMSFFFHLAHITHIR